MSQYAEAYMSADKAESLVGDERFYCFTVSSDCGQTAVYVYPDGSVKAYDDEGNLVEQIAECLEANFGIDLRVGANYSGIVVRWYRFMCRVAFPPFGEGSVNPDEAIAAGWKLGEIVEVWVKDIDQRSGKITLSLREVVAEKASE